MKDFLRLIADRTEANQMKIKTYYQFTTQKAIKAPLTFNETLLFRRIKRREEKGKKANKINNSFNHRLKFQLWKNFLQFTLLYYISHMGWEINISSRK